VRSMAVVASFNAGVTPTIAHVCLAPRKTGPVVE
jgi:hypothetical protein